MQTSLADLLQALDEKTSADTVPVGDAVAALELVGGILERLRFLRTYKRIDIAQPLYQLRQATVSVAERWPAQPAQHARLMGAVADLVGRHAHDFSENDSWHIAISVATLVRRWGTTISESSAHYAPGLPAMINTADQVRRLGAQHPPSPALRGSVHRPFTTETVMIIGRPPTQILAESLGGLVSHLETEGRSALSSRQILGICRTSEIAESGLKGILPADMNRPISEGKMAWQAVREQVTHFNDGNQDPRAGDNQYIWLHARQAHHAVSRLRDDHELTEHAGTRPVIDAVHRLDQLADLIHHELWRIQPRLMISPGPKPLREARTTEWLNHKTFLAESQDLHPVIEAIDGVRTEMARLSDAAELTEHLELLPGRDLAQGISLSL